jgi:hypothetical protein
MPQTVASGMSYAGRFQTPKGPAPSPCRFSCLPNVGASASAMAGRRQPTLLDLGDGPLHVATAGRAARANGCKQGWCHTPNARVSSRVINNFRPLCCGEGGPCGMRSRIVFLCARSKLSSRRGGASQDHGHAIHRRCVVEIPPASIAWAARSNPCAGDKLHGGSE